MLSIFPALIALVSILGLVGHSATQPLIDNLGQLAPGPARDILTGRDRQPEQSRGGGRRPARRRPGAAPSGRRRATSAAFMRASNAIWDVEEGRPIWKLRCRFASDHGRDARRCCASARSRSCVTGPLAEQVGDVIGVGGTAVTVWDIAKWPVLADRRG